VRFSVLDRAVVTYWFEPRSPWGRQWREQIVTAFGYVKDERDGAGADRERGERERGERDAHGVERAANA
jgi:hypothetical protein